MRRLRTMAIVSQGRWLPRVHQSNAALNVMKGALRKARKVAGRHLPATIFVKLMNAYTCYAEAELGHESTCPCARCPGITCGMCTNLLQLISTQA
jgi:hypothetical protein